MNGMNDRLLGKKTGVNNWEERSIAAVIRQAGGRLTATQDNATVIPETEDLNENPTMGTTRLPTGLEP